MPPRTDAPLPVPQGGPALLAAVHTDLRAWRAAHPTATFAEIEAAVEANLARLRARLIADTLPPVEDAQAEGAQEETAATAGPPPICPTCAVPLQRRGHESRTLRVVGDAPVTLHRRYWTCPQCGDGLFPPG